LPSVKPSIPTITLQTAPVVGKSVTLLCQSQSNSLPVNYQLRLSYIWQINGTVIAQSDSRYRVTNNELSIVRVEIGDKYNQYMCTATEEKGLTSEPTVHVLDLICKFQLFCYLLMKCMGQI